MAYKKLSEFIEALRKRRELREIEAPVDPILEVTEIYDRVVKNEGPALLFKNIKGSEIPLAINLFGSHSSMSAALGVKSASEIADRIEEFTDMKPPAGLLDKIQTADRK